LSRKVDECKPLPSSGEAMRPSRTIAPVAAEVVGPDMCVAASCGAAAGGLDDMAVSAARGAGGAFTRKTAPPHALVAFVGTQT